MSGFPQSLVPVYIGGGLWLRVKVLDLPDALKSAEGLKAAISLALQAGEDDAPVEVAPDDSPLPGVRLDVFIKSAEAMGGIARAAVIAHAWADEDAEPSEWTTIRIARNPQDEDPERHVYCLATLDQVSPGWRFTVGDVALRAAIRARDEVRPLSATAT